MADDYKQRYLEVWGEAPPPNFEESQVEEKPAAPQPAAAAPDSPSSPPPHPVDDVDRKANEVIQRMMVDTLRRVEARLAVMDERQADSRSTVPGTVLELCEQLTKLSDEIGRFLQQTRRINEELAGIQIESAKNLAVIANRVRELQSRPLGTPPR